MRRSIHRNAATAIAVLAAAAVIIGSQTGSYLSTRPGPAVPAADTLTVLAAAVGNPDAAPDPLVTTVAADELTNAGALWCALRRDCTTLPIDADTTPETGSTQMRRSLSQADLAANYAAAGHLTWPDAPGDLTPDGTIRGPSAGLTYTLYLLSHRVPGNLFGPHTVAATGTITADGTVGEVGGVTLKAAGAVAAGADVLFVPASEAGTVPPADGMAVVGVTTLTDALAWLCANGSTSALCATLD